MTPFGDYCQGLVVGLAPRHDQGADGATGRLVAVGEVVALGAPSAIP